MYVVVGIVVEWKGLDLFLVQKFKSCFVYFYLDFVISCYGFNFIGGVVVGKVNFVGFQIECRLFFVLCGIEIDGKRFWRMEVIVWLNRCKVEIKE